MKMSYLLLSLSLAVFIAGCGDEKESAPPAEQPTKTTTEAKHAPAASPTRTTTDTKPAPAAPSIDCGALMTKDEVDSICSVTSEPYTSSHEKNQLFACDRGFEVTGTNKRVVLKVSRESSAKSAQHIVEINTKSPTAEPLDGVGDGARLVKHDKGDYHSAQVHLARGPNVGLVSAIHEGCSAEGLAKLAKLVGDRLPQ
jgi:hypothetical protein